MIIIGFEGFLKNVGTCSRQAFWGFPSNSITLAMARVGDYD